uniref:Uncharacterized protein n=1 Tax=Oryza nivara TaxID=4536 RepID=A0A0E0FL65_ORYNI
MAASDELQRGVWTVEDLLAEDAATGDELRRGAWAEEDLLNAKDVATGDELRHGALTVEEDLPLVKYIVAHREYRLIPHKYHLTVHRNHLIPTAIRT